MKMTQLYRDMCRHRGERKRQIQKATRKELRMSNDIRRYGKWQGMGILINSCHHHILLLVITPSSATHACFLMIHDIAGLTL